jgi:hypothetical protein
MSRTDQLAATEARRQFTLRCKVFPGFVSGEYGILIEFDDEKIYAFAPEDDVLVDPSSVQAGKYASGELLVSVLDEHDESATVRLPQQTVNTSEHIDVPRVLLTAI